jgi:hypothetical protein
MMKHVHLCAEDVVSLMKEGSSEWEKYVPDEVGVRQGAAGCGRGVKMCQKRVAKVPKEQDRAGCSMML